jgi:large subunit ribosomal protein L6
MSRIGRMPIAIPGGVKVGISGQQVNVEGPKGKLSRTVHPAIKVEQKDGQILVSRPDDQKSHRALHGLVRSLLANMVTGVTQGYSKSLEIEGVGYRAAVEGSKVTFSLGFSHPVEMQLPKGITVTVDKQVSLNVSGIDKELVGQVAANIRFLKEPEPYRGKGIRYAGEVIRRKAGKAAATGAAAK